MALFCASVLTYLNVRSAPMLENHHFRLALMNLGTDSNGHVMLLQDYVMLLRSSRRLRAEPR
jgi:hypothetical protein